MQTTQAALQSCRNLSEAEVLLKRIGSTPDGIEIMRTKAVFRVIYIAHVETKAANLIKQTFLAKGADAAVSCHSADLSEKYTDVLLFATLQQYRETLALLRQQPWGLKEIAGAVAETLRKSDGTEAGI